MANRNLPELVAKAIQKQKAAFAVATTEDQRIEARREYERDVNEAVHGKRLTTAELFGAR